MLFRPLERIASALMDISLPLFFLLLFILAELPIAPVGNILGRFSIVLNVSAILAVALCLHVTLKSRDAVNQFVLARRLGINLQTYDQVADFFERPFDAWMWLLVDFALLLFVFVMAVGSVLYNLASVSSVYNPFQGEITLISVFLFVLDQACKGMLFDIMEVFTISLPSGITYDPFQHPLFGGLVAIFRMVVTIAFVQVLMLYFGLYPKTKDPRLLRIAEIAVTTNKDHPEIGG
jgi:hypothetical protein